MQQLIICDQTPGFLFILKDFLFNYPEILLLIRHDQQFIPMLKRSSAPWNDIFLVSVDQYNECRSGKIKFKNLPSDCTGVFFNLDFKQFIFKMIRQLKFKRISGLELLWFEKVKLLCNEGNGRAG
jgi:hypothetical protein